MKRILTAISLALLASGAFAQQTPTPMPADTLVLTQQVQSTPVVVKAKRSRSSSHKKSSSSGKSVHVKGYVTKKGTYVAPHSRHAPRRHK